MYIYLIVNFRVNLTFVNSKFGHIFAQKIQYYWHYVQWFQTNRVYSNYNLFKFIITESKQIPREVLQVNSTITLQVCGSLCSIYFSDTVSFSTLNSGKMLGYTLAVSNGVFSGDLLKVLKLPE